MAFMMNITENEYTSLEDQKAQIETELDELQQKLDDMEARDLADSTSDAFFQIKREQGNLQQRLEYINDQLANSDIVDNVDASVVAVGTRVTLQNVEEDSQQTFDIVTTVEAEPDTTRLTSTSPIGEAIMGHTVDDEVTVDAPNGTVTYRIVNIEATPVD